MQLRTLLVGAVATVALIAGSGFAVTQAFGSTQSALDDALIERAVRARWAESGTVDGVDLRVEAQAGAVVLEGRARSEAEALLAEDMAARVNGVSRVENRLSFNP